jgi:hypothetical protein
MFHLVPDDILMMRFSYLPQQANEQRRAHHIGDLAGGCFASAFFVPQESLPLTCNHRLPARHSRPVVSDLRIAP